MRRLLSALCILATAGAQLVYGQPAVEGSPVSAPLGSQEPLYFAVPDVAERATALIAERCGAFRSEAAGYRERAVALAQRESMCRECDYSSAISQAQRQAQVAEQRMVGCVRDMQRVVSEAVEEARLEQMRMTGFEGVAWGETSANVRQSRPEPLIEQDGVLCYESAPAGLLAFACFYFEGAELHHGRYVFAQDHPDPAGHVTDFDRVADSLAVAFGIPESDAEAWTVEPADGDTFARAVAEGRAVRTALWARPGGTMTMQLRGENGEVRHVLEYVPDAPQ